MANRRKYKAILNTVASRGVAEILKTELLQNGEVRVTGLGTFSLKTMQGKKEGFNPGAKIRQSFPPYIKISFNPTGELKKELKKCKIK
jgi:nucleoid DNA-binding protein